MAEFFCRKGRDAYKPMNPHLPFQKPVCIGAVNFYRRVFDAVVFIGMLVKYLDAPAFLFRKTRVHAK